MPNPRACPVLSVVNGKIYVIGGFTVAGSQFPPASTVEAYDPATDTWTQKADMPNPRVALANNAPAVNGKIYVIGGWAGFVRRVNNGLSTVEVYDPATDTWTQKADMSTARGALAISEVGGKIYAIGGSFGWILQALPTVEEYDPATDTWTQKADMPTARSSHPAIAVDGIIYAIGGSPISAAQALATVEAYDTGFRPPPSVSVQPRGKLATVWGHLKATQ